MHVPWKGHLRKIQYNTINTIQHNNTEYNQYKIQSIQYNNIKYNQYNNTKIQYNTMQYKKIQYNPLCIGPKRVSNEFYYRSSILSQLEPVEVKQHSIVISPQQVLL